MSAEKNSQRKKRLLRVKLLFPLFLARPSFLAVKSMRLKMAFYALSRFFEKTTRHRISDATLKRGALF